MGRFAVNRRLGNAARYGQSICFVEMSNQAVIPDRASHGKLSKAASKVQLHRNLRATFYAAMAVL